MIAIKAVFWLALGALLWTHALYPLVVALLARVRPRQVRAEPIEPTVTVVVAAYNEEAAIERRLENLLALDYPAEKLELVVASDASSDRTHELVERFAPRVRLIVNERGGKVAAQNRAVRETESELVAFSDANATWAPDALRLLVRSFADPDVAYVCGRLVLETADGSNREGVYWRYELAQRAAESRLGSITGGNGSIYAVRRSDYVEVDPKWGHDLSFPYRMVQAGRRAVYEPAARAFEKPTPTNETEYRRKVRMFEHCWEIALRGSMLKRLPPGYLAAVISHRVLRYGSGVLHVVLLAASIALVGEGLLYQAALVGQLLLLAAAALGVGLARYYVLVTWATLVALWNYLRRGVPATWTPPRDATRLAERAGGRGTRLGRTDVGPAAGLERASGARDVNRALDVAIAGTGLVLTSPLLAASALAVKLDDRGPVLYRQARVGRDGRDFELLKLRTMIVGAERQGAGYAVAAGDSRITRSAASSAAPRSTSYRSSGTSSAAR